MAVVGTILFNHPVLTSSSSLVLPYFVIFIPKRPRRIFLDSTSRIYLLIHFNRLYFNLISYLITITLTFAFFTTLVQSHLRIYLFALVYYRFHINIFICTCRVPSVYSFISIRVVSKIFCIFIHFFI